MTTAKKRASATEATDARTETRTDLEAMINQLRPTRPAGTDPAGAIRAKTRKTLTLDEDLVAEFGGGVDERQLSPTINALLRIEKASRDQLRALDALLARLETEDGPVDPERVRYFEDLIR